jgi:hypothetical protein
VEPILSPLITGESGRASRPAMHDRKPRATLVALQHPTVAIYRPSGPVFCAGRGGLPRPKRTSGVPGVLAAYPRHKTGTTEFGSYG